MLRTSLRCAAVALALAACSEPRSPLDPTPGNGTQVQLLNALPASMPTTLTLDGAAIPMPASGTSSRRTVEPGSHRLEVRGAGNTLLGSSTFTVPAGSRRAIVLGAGLGSGVAILGTTFDSATAVPANVAKVRAVHTVEGLPSTDLYFRPKAAQVDSAGHFQSPFDFGAGSDERFPGYAIRAPGVYVLRVTSRGTVPVDVPETEVTLAAGELVDLVLVRVENGTIGWRIIRS